MAQQLQISRDQQARFRSGSGERIHSPNSRAVLEAMTTNLNMGVFTAQSIERTASVPSTPDVAAHKGVHNGLATPASSTTTAERNGLLLPAPHATATATATAVMSSGLATPPSSATTTESPPASTTSSTSAGGRFRRLTNGLKLLLTPRTPRSASAPRGLKRSRESSDTTSSPPVTPPSATATEQLARQNNGLERLERDMRRAGLRSARSRSIYLNNDVRLDYDVGAAYLAKHPECGLPSSNHGNANKDFNKAVRDWESSRGADLKEWKEFGFDSKTEVFGEKGSSKTAKEREVVGPKGEVVEYGETLLPEGLSSWDELEAGKARPSRATKKRTIMIARQTRHADER